jgi:hypothetical protein
MTLRNFYDDKTIQAIDGSIAKWEGIYTGRIPDIGHANCPLCRLFIEDKCKDCPVTHYVSAIMCEKTPYISWYLEGPLDGYAKTKKDKDLAFDEIRFLKTIKEIILFNGKGANKKRG